MQVAIITGASRGLGLALAKELADRGWALVIDARGSDALAAAEAELASRTTVRSIAGDVTEPAHRRALVDRRRRARRASMPSSTTPAISARARSQRSPTTRSTSSARSTRSTSSRRSHWCRKHFRPLRPGASHREHHVRRGGRGLRGLGRVRIIEGRARAADRDARCRAPRPPGLLRRSRAISAPRCTRRRSRTRTSPTGRCPRSRFPVSSSCSKVTSRAAGTGRRAGSGVTS